MVRFFNICLILLFPVSSYVFSQSLYNNFPVTNGTVNAIVQSGDNIYLGGQFSYVGPNTGRGVGIDPTTGQLIPGFPDVNGKINIVVSDSAGGWYIGGSFSQVGGVPRNSLAHIKSDKTVTSWNPDINDGLGNPMKVFTIAKFGSLIYVGGLFTQVGSELRTNVAAIDSATGIVTSWNPQPDNAVYSIVVTPLYTFLGGVFNTFAGATDTTDPAIIPGGILPNQRRAVAELFTGQNILTMYNTTLSGGVTNGVSPFGTNNAPGVYAMQLVNGRLYCAGNWGTLGGNASNGLTSIDTTNTYTPTPTGFSPNKNSSLNFRPIFSLSVSGDTIFVGGEFFKFGPINTARNHIAAALISTGAGLATWNPNIAINGTTSNEQANPYYVNSIVVANGAVYVSGKFSTINTNVSRSNIAEIGQSTGTVTSFNPNPSAEVMSIFLQGSTLYAGGNFASINGQSRKNLASINALSGTLNPWNPNPDGQISALAVSGSNVFAGGYFFYIGSDPRSYLAAIDTVTGLASSWQANTSGSVGSLAVGNNLLYVGGSFSAIGGTGSGDVSRNNIAAVDLVTGAVSSWDPNSDGTVYSLLFNGSTIYCGGSFGNIGGQPRATIAALDASTGLATSWNPSANGLVYALGVKGSNIYAGGNFTYIGGQPRNHLACLDATTGTANSWDPNISGTGSPTVLTLAVANSVVYAGGLFNSIGAAARDNIAGIDVATGNATSWATNTDGQVNVISLDFTNQKIYMGGYFTNILNKTASNFGVLDDLVDPALPVELTSFTGIVNGSNVELNWRTATEKNSYGFEIQRSPDGILFNKIGFVPGAHLSNSPKEYSYTDIKLQPGKYRYRLKMVDNDGSFAYSAVEAEEVATPKNFALSQNFPNPFNPSTVIKYQIPQNLYVSLKVYNSLGQVVSTLVNGMVNAGTYQVQFNASKLSSGIYYYVIKAGDNFLLTKKMMFLK